MDVEPSLLETLGKEHRKHTPSMPPTVADAPEPHHGPSAWAALILVTGAALLVTLMLLGGHRERHQPQAALLGVPHATAPIQILQLDEVVIRSADDKVGPPGNPPAGRVFDRAAAESVIRTVGACLADCGTNAVGAMNVVVTFAPSGEATSASVEDGSLRGTPEGSCIAQHLRDVRVPAFDGEQETVRTALALGR